MPETIIVDILKQLNSLNEKTDKTQKTLEKFGQDLKKAQIRITHLETGNEYLKESVRKLDRKNREK